MDALEPFGKRRKEFGEAEGRKAERMGMSESNQHEFDFNAETRRREDTQALRPVVRRSRIPEPIELRWTGSRVRDGVEAVYNDR